jgi:hypothetical protein
MATLVTLLVLFARTVTAQRPTVWGELGIGPGYGPGQADWVVRVAGAVQVGRWMVVGRATNAANILGLFFANDSDVVTLADWALLAGIGSPPSTRHMYAAAGIGVAEIGRQGVPERHRLSLPLEAGASWRPLPVLGLGAVVFANLNSDATFGGVVVTLQAGKLR